ncbi:ribosomal RNA small subunit methyltransferase A [Candidatus Saccharibacteria bacterium]|nr:ribosomal RNA small subunit methyltransferase A [Candidatus Saccharibacteria bacterium]
MSLQNNKSLGQHWLKDRATLLEIAALGTNPTSPVDTVLEVGPGLGTLTSALFQYFQRVIAVEVDAKLAANLPLSFPGKNLTVVNQDILSLDLSQLSLPTSYVVVGNIPYYITSPIIQKFLLVAAPMRPQRIVLLMQKEVAERLAASAGGYSVLALSAQIYADVSLGPIVDRSLFTPPPKVDSRVVVFTPRSNPLATESTLRLIKQGFSAPRKKLVKNLVANLHISKDALCDVFEELQLSRDARPADLSIPEWVALEKRLSIR